MNPSGPPPFEEGDRIQLTRMDHDPCPIPIGTQGTVRICRWAVDRWQISVKWDIDRSLNLVMPPDQATKIGVAESASTG